MMDEKFLEMPATAFADFAETLETWVNPKAVQPAATIEEMYDAMQALGDPGPRLLRVDVAPDVMTWILENVPKVQRKSPVEVCFYGIEIREVHDLNPGDMRKVFDETKKAYLSFPWDELTEDPMQPAGDPPVRVDSESPEDHRSK